MTDTKDSFIPKISVIICTHNSESLIKQCISSIKSQNFPSSEFEIIVIDDESKDNTINIVKSEGVDNLVLVEPCSLGHARNIGVKKARGKIIAFIDSDCIAKDGWLKTIKKELETNQGISGPVFNGNPQSLIAWTEYFMEFSEFNEYKKRSIIDFAPGCNQAYKKDVILNAGGFTNSRMSEDVVFGHSLKKLGVKITFVPELQIIHFCRSELKKQTSNGLLLGTYCYRTSRLVPSIWTNLTKSRFFIPLVFGVKFFARAKRARQSKKFSIFLQATPFNVLWVVSFCKGVWKEIGHHEK